MELLIALLLTLLAVVVLSDILLMVLCRGLALQICFWLALQFQTHIASLVLDAGLASRLVHANLMAFLLLLAIVWCVLKSIDTHVCQASLCDANAVAMDATRIGLVGAVALAMFVTLYSLSHGQLLLVSWIWLTILAVLVAGLDVCCPSILGRVARWFV